MLSLIAEELGSERPLPTIAAGMLALAALSACKPEATQAPPQRPALEVSEIDGLVRQSVSFQGGFLALREQILSTYIVMPATAPWRIECGPLGLRLVLGGGNEDSAVEVVLSRARSSNNACPALAQAAAETMRSIADGR